MNWCKASWKKNKVDPSLFNTLDIYFMQIGYDSNIYCDWKILAPPKKKQPKRTTTKIDEAYRRTYISPSGMPMQNKKEWKKDIQSIVSNLMTRSIIKKSKFEDTRYLFIALLMFFIFKCFYFRLLDALWKNRRDWMFVFFHLHSI